MRLPHPTFNEEAYLWDKGYTYIAGIDEVGRGSFAGPVVAAAVILPRSFPFSYLINDSKQLTAEMREKLDKIIKLYALSYAIAEVPVEVINQEGVGRAAQHAFVQSVQRLMKRPDFLLIDAFPIQILKRTMQKPIIHGDSLSVSIAAASIIAKVYRDNLMRKLHQAYPRYNFFENKGYGTDEHRAAIKKHGLCPLHRTSFNLQRFL